MSKRGEEQRMEFDAAIFKLKKIVSETRRWFKMAYKCRVQADIKGLNERRQGNPHRYNKRRAIGRIRGVRGRRR